MSEFKFKSEWFCGIISGINKCRRDVSASGDVSHKEIPVTTSHDTVSIPLTQNQTAIVDAIDADLAGAKWCAYKTETTKSFYAQRGVRHGTKWTSESMHRVILSRVLGRPLVKGEQVDHIDGDSTNNRRSNLRLATPSENQRNVGRRSDNSSGFKGVGFHKASGKWRAAIVVSGKRLHLGSFDTSEAAHAAYCEAAKKYHGEFARFE